MSELQEIKPPSSTLNIKERRTLNPAVFKQVVHLAGKIKNKTIIHINATDRGGGVAEILQSQIPYECALGLNSRWLVIKAPYRFFRITKKIHNLLQGKPGFLTDEEKSFYLFQNQEMGESLKKYCENLEPGIIVIHDPQAAPLIQFIPAGFFPILRLHIDLTSPNPMTLEFLRPFISQYKYVIISSANYCLSMRWLPVLKTKIIMPAIDPFSPKNKEMNFISACGILEKFGINPAKPIIAQVSRFDPWKDPLGVIKAYYLAKNKVPDLQLVLVGLMTAKDDPEAAEIFKKVEKHAKGDPHIFLFSKPEELGDIPNDVFVNAVYTASNIIIQKSIREGFGMTMTEAMWKGKPVIAGKTCGAMLQIKNKENGILVDSAEEAAENVVRLIRNTKLCDKMGRAARQSVRKKFLFLRSVSDHLKIYQVASKIAKKKNHLGLESFAASPASCVSRSTFLPVR